MLSQLHKPRATASSDTPTQCCHSQDPLSLLRTKIKAVRFSQKLPMIFNAQHSWSQISESRKNCFRSPQRQGPSNLRDALNYCPCRLAFTFLSRLLGCSSKACSRNNSEDANLWRSSSKTDTFALHLCWAPLRSGAEHLSAVTPPNQGACEDAHIRCAIIFLALGKPSLRPSDVHTHGQVRWTEDTHQLVASSHPEQRRK